MDQPEPLASSAFLENEMALYLHDVVVCPLLYGKKDVEREKRHFPHRFVRKIGNQDYLQIFENKTHPASNTLTEIVTGCDVLLEQEPSVAKKISGLFFR